MALHLPAEISLALSQGMPVSVHADGSCTGIYSNNCTCDELYEREKVSVWALRVTDTNKKKKVISGSI